MAFLVEQGLGDLELQALPITIAYHDACHALRSQHIHDAPRVLLERIPDLMVLEIADGDRCCGAAGIYAATQPGLAEPLGAQKATAIIATGATVVASANPGCSVQLAQHLGKARIEVVHPVELLDRALTRSG